VFDPLFALPTFQSEIYAVSHLVAQTPVPFQLNRGCLQVRYDARGHGRSGKPEEEEAWLSARIAEDFLAVAEAFEVRCPIYVGWSLGGGLLTL
jgi:pimeloyl-ACP methyl ester carboxylesterase